MARDKIKQRIANLRAVKKYRKTEAGRTLNVRLCRSFHERIGRPRRVQTYAELKLEVFTRYSKGDPKCECCGEAGLPFLTMDHIKGGGSKHRKEVGSGIRFYKWLKANKFPKGYRVYCYNCNCASHMTGICPHQLKVST